MGIQVVFVARLWSVTLALSLAATGGIATPPASAAPTATGVPVPAGDLLAELRVASPATVAYDRGLFAEGLDADGDGCRTRQEVLIEESLVPVERTGVCTVGAGEWHSYYDEVTHYTSTAVEMDHLVALKEAWVSGAHSWSDAQRAAYANDLDDRRTLVMVTAAVNGAKSDKDPASWLPPATSARCTYVAHWVAVKWRWDLSVDASEADAIRAVLDGCDPADFITERPVRAVGAEPPATGPAAPAAGITPFPAGVTRLGGATRWETAVAASQRFAPGVSTVLVATGRNYPDALSAASAAAEVGAPLLLTDPRSLPSIVRAELQRLSPGKIVVIGQDAAVGASVYAELARLAPEIERVGGSSRVETSRLIMEYAFPVASTAYLATGYGFADALSASGAAGELGAPVVLVNGMRPMPASVMDSMRERGIQNVRIAGGMAVVSASIEAELRAAGFEVTRFGGPNRFHTAVAINDAVFGSGAPSVMFATSHNFPDALAGAALAGQMGAPLYPVMPSCVPEVVREAVVALGAGSRIVMGGTNAVSQTSAANTGCISVSTPTISGSAQVNSTLHAREGGGTTAGATLSYAWYANGARIGTGSSLRLGDGTYGKRITVVVTAQKSGYTSASSTSRPTAAVTRPSRTQPTGGWNCPSWAPIKGNASSMIYHLPSGQYYDRTNPEECFATESAAQSAGYRRSQR